MTHNAGRPRAELHFVRMSSALHFVAKWAPFNTGKCLLSEVLLADSCQKVHHRH